MAGFRSAADPVTRLGQVFTRADVVEQMLSLRRNHGRVLEPTAGEGAFSSHLAGCVAVELDPGVAPPGALVMDFFDYPLSEKFDTVIGNPPFVRRQDILPETARKLESSFFDGRSNLYLHVIEKSVRHLNPGGELIFITPREFIKLTAARKLNAWLAEQGTITHFIETGDARIFGKYGPNCAIWRFEKGSTSRILEDGRRFVESGGQLYFSRGDYSVPLAELFEVKVGAISGADEIFTHEEGNAEFVCSRTIDDGKTRRMFFGVRNAHLERHKERLLARGIRQFNESNWWHWGRQHHVAPGPRLYVNAKTRRKAPFFQHDCPNYDGSMLALFPKRQGLDLAMAADLLNHQVDWQDLGFVCDGRYLFAQRSLQQCMLPDEFGRLLA